uniref:Protrudin n=1 Tax=Rousettus aegyptiacus TaxID=9407 RepID=A0A7J8GJ01_ROUAE|nr:zinc finger FYVE-type containing 27 [Rousettus aegyptiacus]
MPCGVCRAGVPLHAGPGALPRGGQEWKELFPQEDDEGAPCPAEDELALQDNGFLSKNEVLRSKVSRLTERLRKRYPTNNFGSCTGCSATFSVLKKRRSCSNCGNSFCSRCCSFKVPKSSMGATGEWCKQPGDQGSGRAWLVPTSAQEVLPEDRSEGSMRGQRTWGPSLAHSNISAFTLLQTKN